MVTAVNSLAERVLVLMPTRTDAERTAQFLSENYIGSAICSDLAQLCQELRLGAGALLVTDETLLNDTSGQLAEALRDQPAWSFVPVLVVARDRAVNHVQRVSLDAFGSVTIIERPVRMQTLIGMVAAALRTRRHQYQIRDAIQALDRQATELVARDEKLQFTLSALQASESGGKRILVVDDNEDAAELLSLMLEQQGHTTCVARDGETALTQAAKFDPEIIFLDIGLPGTSGYEVARQLRQDPRFAKTALIALTGWGTAEDKRRAAAAGFDLHLTKPIDGAAVQAALEHVVAAPRS